MRIGVLIQARFTAIAPVDMGCPRLFPMGNNPDVQFLAQSISLRHLVRACVFSRKFTSLRE